VTVGIEAAVVGRAARHAALGDATRLAIVDELVGSDRSPVELQQLIGVPSNLLAHHLDVLEQMGMITRSRSSGDGRRRYIRLRWEAMADLSPGPRTRPQPVLFVCTQNSARSQIAAALWTRLTDQPADSAGTHPAERVHPGAIAAARRAGLDISHAVPRHLDEVRRPPQLVVTVCDRAHEELTADRTWLHWSIPDPVATPSRAAFDGTVAELGHRISCLVAAS
jgi:protein-tyrosine-phosphatase/DNA-binding transcriptional ArsR family regulator